MTRAEAEVLAAARAALHVQMAWCGIAPLPAALADIMALRAELDRCREALWAAAMNPALLADEPDAEGGE